MNKQKITPNYGEIFVTENCNLNCQYCYEKDNHLNRVVTEEVIEETVEFLIKNAKAENQPKFDLTLFGGEPTLAVDKMEYILEYAWKRAKEEGLEYTQIMISNATIFNDELKNFLLNWREKIGHIQVQLSVDGPPHVQDEYRITNDGKGSSKIVEETLKKYIEFAKEYNIELGSEISIHPVISKNSMPYLYEIYEYSRSWGFPGFWYMLDEEAEWDSDDIEIFKEQLYKIVERIKEDTEKENTQKYVSNFNAIFQARADHPDKSCSAGVSYVSILPNGDMYPCHRFRYLGDEFKLGNILEFDEELFDSKRQIFKDTSTENLMGTMQCKDCDNTTCKKCLAVNYKVHGNMNINPEPYCNMIDLAQKEVKEYAIDLFEKEFGFDLRPKTNNSCSTGGGDCDCNGDCKNGSCSCESGGNGDGKTREELANLKERFNDLVNGIVELEDIMNKNNKKTFEVYLSLDNKMNILFETIGGLVELNEEILKNLEK